MDKDNKPVKGVREGKTLPIKRLGEKLEGVSSRDVILAAVEDTTIREIMEARLNATDNPVIVLSNSEKFKGIINEREILRGILEKGRKDKKEKGTREKEGEG